MPTACPASSAASTRTPSLVARARLPGLGERGAPAVRVRDTGCGMAPRPDSPGMGLGLSLMGTECDHFEVRCADGGGTEVLLRFVLPEPAAPPCTRITR